MVRFLSMEPQLSDQLPRVDVSGLVEGDASALARVGAALVEPCRTWGAFHVVGHGISPAEFADLDASMATFFDLPDAVKKRVRRTRDNAWGYYDEELTKNRPDWKEVFDYGPSWETGGAGYSDGVNQWPAEAPALRASLERHFAAFERVARALLRALCVSLGLKPDTLDPAFAGHSSFMRLNYYPPCADAAAPDAPLFPDEGRLGIHHHTDAGALTVLYQGKVPGLQVLRGDRRTLVEPVPGALTINLGDMLQVWSNGRYHSPVHRVIVGDRMRYSAPFFLNPAYTAVCAPLPELVSSDTPAVYRPISWSEFRGQRSAGDFADYGAEIQISDFRIA